MILPDKPEGTRLTTSAAANTVTQGDSVTFTCHVTAAKPQVSHYRFYLNDTTPVKDSEDSQYTISNVQRSQHYGEYKCVPHNDVGDGPEATVTLNVNDAANEEASTSTPELQKWEEKSVRLLIENYIHFKHLLKKGKTTKKDVFQKIASRFNEISAVKPDGSCQKTWKFFDELEEAMGDSPKVNPEYTFDVASGGTSSSLTAQNSESDDESDAEDGENGSTTKGAKNPKSRKRKRKSYFSASEMLSFLHSYTEKKEKVEEEKLNLLREMKEEKKEFFSQFLDVYKKK
ncbi:hypothetical protein ACROYT_G028489 [Oculina patagonica]